MTPEQREKIREIHAPFVEKYRAHRAERRDLVEARAQGHRRGTDARAAREGEALHRRADRARARGAVCGRTAADGGRQTWSHRGAAHARSARSTPPSRRNTTPWRTSAAPCSSAELKAIGEELTSDQRDRVQNFFEDRAVVVGIEIDPNDPDAIAQLRETVAERLRAVADKLGLTEEQRNKIRETHAAFVEKYEAQRNQRRDLRREELQGLRRGADTRAAREGEELHRGSRRVSQEQVIASAGQRSGSHASEKRVRIADMTANHFAVFPNFTFGAFDMNLVEQIKNQLSSGVLSQLSSLLGASEGTTGTAVSAAVPALLSALSSMASSSSGAQKLLSALSQFSSGSVESPRPQDVEPTRRRARAGGRAS